MTVSRHGVDAMREKVAGLRRLHTALEDLLAGKPRFLSVFAILSSTKSRQRLDLFLLDAMPVGRGRVATSK